MCDKDLENLRRWSFNVTEDQSDILTPQGREDLFLLGRRIKTDFPDLLNWAYTPERYQVSDTGSDKICKDIIRISYEFATHMCEPTLNTTIHRSQIFFFPSILIYKSRHLSKLYSMIPIETSSVYEISWSSYNRIYIRQFHKRIHEHTIEHMGSMKRRDDTLVPLQY